VAVGVIAASIVLVAATHALRRVRPKGGISPFILLTFGIILGEIGISATIAVFGLHYNLRTIQMVESLAGLPTDRPIVLLVGSSLTQYAIDGDLLAQQLTAAGHPVTFGRLGLGGLSIAERYHYIKQYLAIARRRPSMVLFEISKYYDTDPLRQLQQNPYAAQEVAGMGLDTAWLSLEWLIEPYNDDPLDRRIMLAGTIIGHLLLNTIHAGFMPLSISAGRMSHSASDEEPRKQAWFGDAFFARELATITEPLDDSSRVPIPNPWLSRILEMELGLFRADGAKVFGFYQTPTTLRQEYSYGASFCSAMVAFPCIMAGDPELLAGLSHDEDWYDRMHLIGEGRRLYTLWFADRLLKQTTLP
jgi:hypothetical protein